MIGVFLFDFFFFYYGIRSCISFINIFSEMSVYWYAIQINQMQK